MNETPLAPMPISEKQLETLVRAVLMTRISETAVFPMLLTEKRVAVVLNVSTRTIQRLANESKPKRVPIGTKLTADVRHRPGRACVGYRRREVLKLAETGWVW